MTSKKWALLEIIKLAFPAGEIVFYPVTENHHCDGVLRLSISQQDDPMQVRAEAKII